MITSTHTNVQLNGTNKSYYQALGYSLPTYFCPVHKKEKVKRGTFLEVQVAWVCDCCKKEYRTMYKNYMQCHESADKARCMRCWNDAYSANPSLHPNYNPELTAEDRKPRKFDSKEKQWRKSVYIRDNYTCQDCFIKENALNAHHVKEYSRYPELRYALENGLTLCVPCSMRAK